MHGAQGYKTKTLGVQSMQVTQNEATNVTSIVTLDGQASLPTALYNLFAACNETALVDVVKAGTALGFTNGFIRAQVQVLAQPGQYNGSACIGALATSTQGKRVFLTWGAVAVARPKLTRTGSNTPAAQALSVEAPVIEEAPVAETV